MRVVLRVNRYGLRTEQAYCDWVRRYVTFHGMKSKADLTDGTRKVEEFLTHLAQEWGEPRRGASPHNVHPPPSALCLAALHGDALKCCQRLASKLFGHASSHSAGKRPAAP